MPNEIDVIDKTQVKEDYLNGMKYKDLADEYNVTINTVKSWVKRYNWSSERGAHKTEKGCTRNIKEGALVKSVQEDKKEIIIRKVRQEVENTELTEKQRLFVAEYLTDFNATRAAMSAGYSKNTAMEQGSRLLRNVKVQAEIKQQTEVLFDSIGLTQQRILMDYMKIAGADVSNYLTFGQREVPVMTMYGPLKDEDGNVVMKTVNYVDFKESSEVDTSLISEVKLGKDGASIKLYDKMKAMDILARYEKIIMGGININVQQNNINVTLEDDESEQ